MRARVSFRFKLPTQLGIYEGKTDLMDHLDLYKSLMILQGCSNEVMCTAFSATLKGSTRSWFRKLPPGTIDSFGDLSRLFVANFKSCWVRQKNASHIFTIHQIETELLKDYVKRYSQAILEIEDPSDKVVIMVMMEGLRPGLLFDSLSKMFPTLHLSSIAKLTNTSPQKNWPSPSVGNEGRMITIERILTQERSDYRDESRSKRFDRDSKRTNKRHPRTPPRRPKLIFPPLNVPTAQMFT
ncbi:uncharacterized protein LOC130751453 [Actinidia eriantha]|uniref:uncharacterized protein LOC130751453 n=1 Tax=Actinidia eriantha TaxID=165200 RepID=UPI00258DA0FB|nr:uncharacterized protein LOC130751453 [Actinidia eriantha]